MASLPPSPTPTRLTFEREPAARRSDSTPFFMHNDHDSFYHSRKSSLDLEAGCLVPADSIDGTTPNPTSAPSKPKKGSRRSAYQVWFSQNTPHSQAAQLPTVESYKGAAEFEPRLRSSKFERRLAAGSWCGMLALMVLTIYFLMRET
ncbi:hypothetical protein B0H12DRAFT_313356 [Mycena haematopus]|nr:hypothetical protein B0H12DRAFT_313356 [Mycena haematopus]